MKTHPALSKGLVLLGLIAISIVIWNFLDTRPSKPPPTAL
jgi:hypothetical protein